MYKTDWLTYRTYNIRVNRSASRTKIHKMKFKSLLCTIPPIVPVGVGVDVGMVGEGQSLVGMDESRSGLCWEHRRHVKGVAGVPSLQRRQVKGAAEVSVLVVEQSRQMKGCCRVPITHCLHFRALNEASQCPEKVFAMSSRCWKHLLELSHSKNILSWTQFYEHSPKKIEYSLFKWLSPRKSIITYLGTWFKHPLSLVS